MPPIIRVENLGKEYRIGQRDAPYATLRESLAKAARAPFSRARQAYLSARDSLRPQSPVASPQSRNDSRPDRFWALKDVSFEVQPGEVVGIIGRNGAGKSTLLKILSRITEPTTGRVDLYGRVGSLLEVGTGFHPELTGRENIYLNGAILGMTRREIDRRFDEIVDFAEVEKFIDTPVKRYSSGMYMRLAFSVAANLNSEVLVIDEVLAVGDTAFQNKCIGKMSDASRKGRTVLFVSHNMTAVKALCTSGLCLDQGSIACLGETGAVVRTAMASSLEQPNVLRTWNNPHVAPGNDRIRLKSARLLTPGHLNGGSLTIRNGFSVQFEYWLLQSDVELTLFMPLFNQDGHCIFVSASIGEPAWDGRAFPQGLYRSTCHIPADLLNSDVYRISLLFSSGTTTAICHLHDILHFSLQDDASGRGRYYGKWDGIVRPRLQWSTERLR